MVVLSLLAFCVVFTVSMLDPQVRITIVTRIVNVFW